MESDSSENVKNNSDSLFCFVDGCFTTSSRNKNLGFHQFPPNDEKRFLRKYKNGSQKLVNTRQLWIEALNIEKEGTTVIGKMRVCSLHFSKNDYYIKDAKKPFANLKRTAIPRRNLPLRKNSKLTTRLQVRGFNRLKWRGRLSFQDLDVRVPISRNRPIKKTEQKEVTKKTPQNVVVVEEEVEPVKIDDDEEECIQVEGFSLASLEDGMEKTIVLDGESVSTEKEQITSEFIIKEEPLSDNEQEMEEWNDENIIVEQNVNDNQETVWMTPQTAIDNQQAITTESVLEDLESSGDEAGLSRKKNEENKKEREDEKEKEGDEEEETSLRDRPCKQCGSRDCRGHDERLSPATFVCMVCNELFHTSAQLDAHSEKHDEELNMYGNSWHDDFVYRNSKDLECKICGKHFATKTVLKEHVSRHVGDKLLVCLLCGRQFRHKINLVVHVNAHTIVRNFACPQCPMVFALRVDLEDHRGMHAEYGHKCKLCGAGFGSQRALWTHKQVHTRRFASKKKKGSTSSNTIARNGYIKKSSFPCRVCGKVLSTKNTLREHMMIHSGEKPHECMLCGKLIRHKANFIIHVHSHSMRRQHHPLAHFCDLCETDFASKTELCQHQVEAHANRCEVCEMDFVSRGELHKHQMEEHSDSSHKCILCGDTFLSEEGLMEHVEGVHGDKKGEEYELFRPHMLEGL